MANFTWTLTDGERKTLERALDALLPPTGSFPQPSATNVINQFILQRVPAADEHQSLYPGLDAPRLKSLLSDLGDETDMAEALSHLQLDQPNAFKSLWSLVVYGYYSRSETIAAIQQELAPAYHGAPLPTGYAQVIERWNANDPLQLPRSPRGMYLSTDEVRRVDLTKLTNGENQG